MRDKDIKLEEVYSDKNADKDLVAILDKVLSEMTDEEFEEAWQKTKERVGYYGTSNQIL